MAVERVVDLEHQRFADREYTGVIQNSTAGAEAAAARRRERALERLREKAAADPVVTDLLIVLGLDTWTTQ
jgi:hypothetical protein